MDEDEETLLKKLKGLVTNIQWSPKEVADLFDALLKRFESSVNDKSHLLTWMGKMLHCIEIHFITSDWKNEDGKTLLELVQEKTVTDETLKEYLANDRKKTLDKIIDEIRQEKLNQVDENLLNDVRDIVSTVNEGRDIPEDGSQKSELKTILKKLCLAVEKTKIKDTKKLFRPRLTQMVSWCLMALSETGRLILVGTGEGKSCIVAMFAAFRALRGEKVDIMSSSSVLAARDCKEWKGFYKELNITADYNCNRPDGELKKCYECQVVYGTAEDFAGDWLRHHFHSVVRAVEEEVKRSIHFTPCELNQAKTSCYIPGFFSELVKSKLKVWIENAFEAQLMTEDHEYVMEKHGIVPVDYSCTGVVENNMKWTDGLQQFIEMRHESKMSDMTAITNYMSNVGLLQKYKNQFGSQIYGMSGTLGQEKETETLQKIYDDIKTCQIPSFKCRKLFEAEGVVVEDEKEWIKKLCDVVIAQTSPTSYRDPRAVLIICETIKRAKMIHRSLGNRVQNKKLSVNNNMDNSVVISKELEAGRVIIATNLAGRGTDLQVSDTVKEAGGLFVVQTFLPKNARVEAQAFGRTARQGSPGSAQLIMLCTNNHKPEASDLSALNEFWGMWLLTSFSAKDSTEELKSRLKTDLDTAKQKLRQKESPSSNLYHYISFGNNLREKGKFAESINMYTKAIQRDHCWGAIAYYNRAFKSLKQQDRSQSPDCINRALEDLQNALKSVQLHCDQLEVTQRFSNQHINKDNDDSLTRLDEQFMARYRVLVSFKEHITEAIKKVVKARDVGGEIKVEKKTTVYALVSLVHSVPLK
ncbi:unnamed protein product [Oreochromis niloticus]|nr:unnamed protein product [Mustela putorius furo]